MSDVCPPFLPFPDSTEPLLTCIKRWEKSFPYPTNVVFLGNAGSGKSNFISSVYSTLNGEIFDIAESQNSPNSLTRILHCHEILDKINFWDPQGFDNGLGEIDITKLGNLFYGHLGSGMRMDQRIGHDTPGYCMSPTDKQKMHVVVGVLPCSEVGNETAIGRLSKIRDLLTSSPEAYGAVRFLILLTFSDKFEEAAIKGKNPVEGAKALYASQAVADLRDKVHNSLGVKTSNILPVWNYDSAIEVNRGQDTILLTALKRILAASVVFFKETNEKNRDQNRNNGCKKGDGMTGP